MARIRRTRILDVDWECHRITIKRLYLDERRTLEGKNGVVQFMQEHYGFSASKAQYETRFRKWGFRKYLKREDWQALGHILKDRKIQGLPSEVYFYDELLPEDKIHKEVSRYLVDNESYWGARSPKLPEGVKICKPACDKALSSDPSPKDICDTSSSDESGTLLLRGIRTYSPLATIDDFFASAESDGMELSILPSHFPTPACSPKDFAFLSSGLDNVEFGFPNLSTILAPENTLTLFQEISVPLLERSRGSNAQLSRVVAPSLLKSMLLLPISSQKELQKKPFNVVFFNMIMFLLMNNFAGSDDATLEKLFEHFGNFSIPEMEQVLDSIPHPFADALQQSILTIAIRVGVVAIVRTLLQRDINIDKLMCRYAGSTYTPLGLACKFRHIEVVRLLVQAGIDVNRLDGVGGRTPIFHLSGNFECSNTLTNEKIPSVACDIFALLLQAGSRVGWYEMEDPVFWNTEPWLNVYLEHCQKPLEVTQVYHIQRPLANAMNVPENDRVTKAIKVLLGENFKVERDTDEQLKLCYLEALRCAAFQNNEDVVDFFIAAGLQPTDACLAEAVRGNSWNVAHRLLQAGVNPDSVIRQHSNHGRDILLPYAGSLPQDIESLLQEKFRVRHECITPVAEAIRWQRRSFVQLFRECGALSTLNESSRFNAALVAAAEAGDVGMTRDLVEQAKQSPGLIVPASSLAISVATLGGHVTIIHMLMTVGVKPVDASLTAAILVRNHTLLHLFLDAGTSTDMPGLMFFAVRWGNIEVIQDLISAGATLNEYGWRIGFLDIVHYKKDPASTPLGQALRKDDECIIQLLLNSGVDISMENRTGFTYKGISPLTVAVQSGSTSFVEVLLRRGAEPNDPMALLESTYHSVVMIETIIAAFNRQYPAGKRYFASKALRRAIRAENLEQVKLLVRYTDLNDREQRREETEEHNMRISQYDEFLPTPLGEAIVSQNAEIIQTLLAHGADPNSTVATKVRYPHTGRWTALLQAIHTGNLATVRQICDAGAKVNTNATLGLTRTPLQLAVEIGSVDIVRLLLNRGADVNAEPCIRGGGTALQLAAINGYVGIAETLIGHGANIDAARALFQGRTAFEGAAEHGRMDMLLHLYHRGVDIVSDGGEQVRRAVEFAEKNGQLAAKSLVTQLSRSRHDPFAIGLYD